MWAFLLSVRCNIAQSLYDVASFCRTYLGPDGLLLDKEAAYRNGAQSCSAISDYCEKKLGVMPLAFAASFVFICITHSHNPILAVRASLTFVALRPSRGLQ